MAAFARHAISRPLQLDWRHKTLKPSIQPFFSLPRWASCTFWRPWRSLRRGTADLSSRAGPGQGLCHAAAARAGLPAAPPAPCAPPEHPGRAPWRAHLFLRHCHGAGLPSTCMYYGSLCKSMQVYDRSLCLTLCTLCTLCTESMSIGHPETLCNLCWFPLVNM